MGHEHIRLLLGQLRRHLRHGGVRRHRTRLLRARSIDHPLHRNKPHTIRNATEIRGKTRSRRRKRRKKQRNKKHIQETRPRVETLLLLHITLKRHPSSGMPEWSQKGRENNSTTPMKTSSSPQLWREAQEQNK